MSSEPGAGQTANVTVIFALGIIPVVGAVGAAVDYSHGSSVKAAMQAAADSTALMLAKNVGAKTIPESQINQKANEYFSALLNRKHQSSLTA